MGCGSIVELHYELFQEGISRVVGSDEGFVLRPFWKPKGEAAGTVRRNQAVALGRLHPEEEERWAGQAGLAGRPSPSGEGESRPVGEEGRWARLGQKSELGHSSRNKILSNFIWNLDFWQTLKFV
jgi:hypothetical protein